MRVSHLVASSLFSFSASVAAQDSCSAYVNQKVEVISPAAALLRYKSLPQKSEFETSTQFGSRVAAFAGNGPLILAKKAENATYLQYDADAAKLLVYRGLFGPELDAWKTFVGASHWDILKPSLGKNVGIVLEYAERATGSYTARNAFGATTSVKRIRRITTGVYDRAGLRFPITTGPHPSVIGELPMSPVRAQALKPTLRVALVAWPKYPYLIRGSRIAELPSLNRPKKVDEDFSILIADIGCGLLVEPSGTVLAAYKARANGD